MAVTNLGLREAPCVHASCWIGLEFWNQWASKNPWMIPKDDQKMCGYLLLKQCKKQMQVKCALILRVDWFWMTICGEHTSGKIWMEDPETLLMMVQSHQSLLTLGNNSSSRKFHRVDLYLSYFWALLISIFSLTILALGPACRNWMSGNKLQNVLR